VLFDSDRQLIALAHSSSLRRESSVAAQSQRAAEKTGEEKRRKEKFTPIDSGECASVPMMKVNVYFSD
jgi:hypothetical protein